MTFSADEHTQAARRAALAAALSEARRSAGLSRADLAARVGIDVSVLSRLESGRYFHHLKASTLDLLTETLRCGWALYLAAGIAHPDVSNLAADQQHYLAFNDLPAASTALRRLHLQNFAETLATQTLTADGRRVDEKKLWRLVAGGTLPAPASSAVWGAGAAAARFKIAHDAAHVILQTTCRWPRVEAGEQDTNELAAALLAPAAQLGQALRTVLSMPRDLWAPDADGVLEAVADFLVIPGWVALRCLGSARDLEFYLQPEEQEN
ncbi:helix-turn-helix domain-containing protein [Catenuloplanes sp. NPDC051500]|uniref:helix-turn-helix domain-containing protein n=1 Tax=Catenuloplanes sp. NPDC051500 TaxID=3363959 RepID=UPI0037950F0C